MAPPISSLPEELLLRTFSYLRLDDLAEVIRTCKQFHRISQDLPAATISEIALRTGEFLPGLRPSAHFLAVAAAPRLREWVVQGKGRRAELHKALHAGINSFAKFALNKCPITLDDIRDPWSWTQRVLNPASDRLNTLCGPPSRGAGEDIFTRCEHSSLALWNWTLYGELFRHSPPFNAHQEAPLDLATRLKFIAFCVPDTNCCNYLQIPKPHDFMELDDSQYQFQQLDLYYAITHGDAGFFLPADFAKRISQLISLDVAKAAIVADDLDEEYTKEALFVQIVRSSGRRSVEVLALDPSRSAEVSKPAPEGEGLVQWLNSLWASVNTIPQSELRSVIQTSFNPDEIVRCHVNSFDRELMYALWGTSMLQYPPRKGTDVAYYHEADEHLRGAVNAGRKE